MFFVCLGNIQFQQGKSTVQDRIAIKFEDIVDACTIEHDDYPELPWEDWDGWEHDELNADYCENADERRGYFSSRWDARVIDVVNNITNTVLSLLN